ncbi:hypothetical protein [Lutispora sp.]|uniref:hypothetical protein n=1 Tax=Lutispora sp. TaxID=2828727 RepID=UPI000ED572B5|nr:hypothetical protein [Lutispora sp.]MEA4962934.1 hypothetical protein [Lutispora sp.]HCJ58506.1 hypothetical protein [Clostridiaceae bacterium]
MKGLYRIQSIILCFVGVGALFGGMLGITDPYGVSFGMSTELLKRGPFTSFLIPGLFLFIAIGLGHLAAFVFVKRRMKFHPYISGAAGCILMAWIMIQCYMLQSINILHVIFFMIGLAESGISLYMLVKLKQFPFS